MDEEREALFPKGKLKFIFREEDAGQGEKKPTPPPQNKKTKKQAQQISTVEEGGKNIIHKEISI